MKFEEKLKKLEEIVSSIESGEKGIEESMKLFEEAVGLKEELQSQLVSFEGKLEELVVKNSGAASKPFGKEE